MMGSYYSREQTWYVYSRDVISDSWNKEPLFTSNDGQMGSFKHLVFKFALQIDAEQKSYKALYLYSGSTRYAKAELIRPQADQYYKLEMEFKHQDVAEEWDLADEKILNQKTLWKEVEFNKHYVSLPEDVKYKRRWQLVKSLEPQIAKPRLSLGDYINYSGIRRDESV